MFLGRQITQNWILVSNGSKICNIQANYSRVPCLLRPIMKISELGANHITFFVHNLARSPKTLSKVTLK